MRQHEHPTPLLRDDGPLVDPCLAYHFFPQKYSQKQRDFTEMCLEGHPNILGQNPKELRNEGNKVKQRQDPSTKPYYRCLSCTRFRKSCGGIPTRGMDLQNWCEYLRDVKDLARLTNARIAEEADVSVKTIERIMAINVDQDIRRATARRIELAIIGPVGDNACYLDHDPTAAAELISQLRADVEYWKKENDRKAKLIDKLLD